MAGFGGVRTGQHQPVRAREQGIESGGGMQFIDRIDGTGRAPHADHVHGKCLRETRHRSTHGADADDQYGLAFEVGRRQFAPVLFPSVRALRDHAPRKRARQHQQTADSAGRSDAAGRRRHRKPRAYFFLPLANRPSSFCS